MKKKKKITPDRELAVKNLQKSILEGSRKKKDEQFPMRINRYLAVCGLGSRRQVESYVTRGRVSLNGKKISGLDAKVNFNDTVQVDGKTIRFDGVFTYLAMNKPPGYTVSKRRFKNDRTIYELLDETQHHVKYAGRLDRDSRGLLILSDDGNFITAVTHPSRRITKKYHVTVDHLTEMNEIQREFSRGIYDEGELLKAVRVRILDKEKKIIEVVLGEGKKRQLRRMFRALGMKIIDLYRVSVGFLSLENLKIQEGQTAAFNPDHLLYGSGTDQGNDSEILKNFNPWEKI